MSDARLRELERRWRETGAVQDEAAYLSERVRVGELKHEQIMVAAYLDHASSKILAPNMKPASTEANEFYAELGKLSLGALDHACIAMIVEIRAVWEYESARSQLAASIRCMLGDTSYFSQLEIRCALITRSPRSSIHDIATAVLGFDACMRSRTIEDALKALTNTLLACQRLRQRIHEVSAVRNHLIAWALGNDPLPALLARLEAEAAGSTPTTPPG